MFKYIKYTTYKASQNNIANNAFIRNKHDTNAKQIYCHSDNMSKTYKFIIEIFFFQMYSKV